MPVVLGSGMVMPLVLLGLGVYLAYAYRGSFRGVLNIEAKPTETDSMRPSERAAMAA